MAEFVIFTAPKPFTDPFIATIQRNAINSWLNLSPEAEIILVGDEEGVEQAAEETGVRYIPEVQRNLSGTPLVSSIFSQVRNSSDAPLMMYVNADIILFPDAIASTRQVSKLLSDFLVVGQRWDLDIDTCLDFTKGSGKLFREAAWQNSVLHPPAGSDYFFFPRHLFADIPDFAIGRAGWDNWMIYEARANKWLVVDASPSIFAVHQNHDYRHLPGGKPHYIQQESFDNE